MNLQRFERCCSRNAECNRAGATLLELLVVIVIISILSITAIPVLAPLLSNRQVTEASRMVESFLTGARNRAMQSGRSAGVVLERLAGVPEACVHLYYVEVPAPYSGDSVTSTATVTITPNVGGDIYQISAFTPQFDNSGNLIASGDIAVWNGMARLNDLIRFNYQGQYFQLVETPNAPNNKQPYDRSTFYFNYDPANQSQPIPWTFVPWPLGTKAVPPSGPNVRYQIVRAPVRVSGAGLQLPGSTIIDLNFSGFDIPNNITCPSSLSVTNPPPISPWVPAYSFQPVAPWAGVDMKSLNPSRDAPFGKTADGSWVPDPSTVMIMFSPSGALEKVWSWANNGANFDSSTNTNWTTKTNPNPTWTCSVPMTSLHLLVGRRELVPLPFTVPASANPAASDFKPYANWQDPSCFWVTINSQSGNITTTENMPSTTAIANGGYDYGGFGSFQQLMEARRLAQQSQRMGGHR